MGYELCATYQKCLSLQCILVYHKYIIKRIGSPTPTFHIIQANTHTLMSVIACLLIQCKIIIFLRNTFIELIKSS